MTTHTNYNTGEACDCGRVVTDLERLDEALDWLDHQPHAEALTAARELRKYRDLLANGQRVEPDYESAFRARWDEEIRFEMTQAEFEIEMESVRLVVDAAVGGRLLVDPLKEEER